MVWQHYIHSDKDILAGKPVIKGTRLSVVFILELFGAGWTEEKILENYSTIKPEHLKAVFNYGINHGDSFSELGVSTTPSP